MRTTMVKEEYLLYKCYSAEIQKLVYSLIIKQPMRRFLPTYHDPVHSSRNAHSSQFKAFIERNRKAKTGLLVFVLLGISLVFLVLVSSDQQFLFFRLLMGCRSN